MGKAIGLAAGLALLSSTALHAQSGTIINCTSPREDPGNPPLTFQISDGAIYWYNLETRRFEHVCRMWNIERPITEPGEPAKCSTLTTAQSYIVQWDHRYQFSEGGNVYTQNHTLMIDRFTLKARLNATTGNSFQWDCKIGGIPNVAPKI